MQTSVPAGMAQRLAYYVSALYVGQLSEGQRQGQRAFWVKLARWEVALLLGLEYTSGAYEMLSHAPERRLCHGQIRRSASVKLFATSNNWKIHDHL
jgi:hypothetical protein